MEVRAAVLFDGSITPDNIGLNQIGARLYAVSGCCKSFFSMVSGLGGSTVFRCLCDKTSHTSMFAWPFIDMKDTLEARTEVRQWIADWTGLKNIKIHFEF